MVQTVSDRDAKAQFAAILDRIDHGEEIVITRDGIPVAKVVPVSSTDLDTKASARERYQRAADGLRELGAQLRLDGITIRELIDDGRR